MLAVRAGLSLQPLTRRKDRSASSIPTPTHRRAILGSLQLVTRPHRRSTTEIIDSTALVQLKRLGEAVRPAEAAHGEHVVGALAQAGRRGGAVVVELGGDPGGRPQTASGATSLNAWAKLGVDAPALVEHASLDQGPVPEDPSHAGGERLGAVEDEQHPLLTPPGPGRPGRPTGL